MGKRTMTERMRMVVWIVRWECWKMTRVGWTKRRRVVSTARLMTQTVAIADGNQKRRPMERWRESLLIRPMEHC